MHTHNPVNPTLTIIRGLPGSGKSTLAKMISNNTRAKHCEADMFFVNHNGVYVYDPSKIKRAHTWCQVEVENALGIGKDVVVSNTFTQLWEMQKYIDMAKQYNCNIQIIECKGKFGNIHNVPKEVVAKMRERWQYIDNETLSNWIGG